MDLCSLPAIYLDPNYGGGNEDKGDLLQGSHAGTATLIAPNPAAGHLQPTPVLQAPGHSQASLGQSLWGHYAFSWALMHRVLLYPPRVYFPVLCNFWQLCGGVNGDLLQEGLCHTLVCCTQSPCPCCSSLLTHTSTGDAQAQFCLSLCGVPGWASDKLKLELQLHLLENKTKDFNSQPVEKCEYKS